MPQAPQAEKLSQCLLLAVLLHALLLLWVGTAPGGTARPGDGVGGRLNVTLTGGTGDQNAVRPQAAPAQRQQGPVGKGRQERHGGVVRPAEAPQPLPMTPGAAREGEWASRVPEPGEATDALDRVSPAATDAAPAADVAPPAIAATDPTPAPDPFKLPELRAPDADTLPPLAALAEPMRNTAVLSAPPGRELPASSRLKNRPPSDPLGRVPALPSTVTDAATALAPTALPSLPPVLRRLEDLPMPEAPKSLAELRPAPVIARRLEAQPPRPLALGERLPAIAKRDPSAVPPPTLTPPLDLPAARLPAHRTAAVSKLQPLPHIPTEPLAQAPEIPAAGPVQPPSAPSAVTAKAVEPAASAALAAAPTMPELAPTPASNTATSAAPTKVQASAESETSAPKAAAVNLMEAGGTRPRLGAPDAGPRLGRDVATPASASPEVKPLNLQLPRPRGGELSAQGSRGVLPLMPQPPERKSKLSESMEEAKRADCRKAYGEQLGLLAAVPLALDAVRGGNKGCQW